MWRLRLFFVFGCLASFADGCARTSGGGGGGGGTTPVTNPCNAPSGDAGLTIDTGTTLQNADVNEAPNAQCTSCPSGTRQFYTATTQTTPSNAIGSAQVAEGVQCPTPSTFCTCDSLTGVCCSPGATAPDSVEFIPTCSGGSCFMAVVLQGADGTTLTCTNGQTFSVDATNADDALTSASYFHGDSASCNGCNNIQNDQCQGPTVPISS